MATKSTIAVGQHTRLLLKKLAVLLNKTQGDIVEQALRDFEIKIISAQSPPIKEAKDEDFVEKILREATEEVYAKDPTHKELQMKLKKSGDSIDDYLIRTWNSGMEE